MESNTTVPIPQKVILTTKYHKNIEVKGLSWYNKRIVSGSFFTCVYAGSLYDLGK